MLSDLHTQRRDVEHLTGLHPGNPGHLLAQHVDLAVALIDPSAQHEDLGILLGDTSTQRNVLRLQPTRAIHLPAPAAPPATGPTLATTPVRSVEPPQPLHRPT